MGSTFFKPLLSLENSSCDLKMYLKQDLNHCLTTSVSRSGCKLSAVFILQNNVRMLNNELIVEEKRCLFINTTL